MWKQPGWANLQYYFPSLFLRTFNMVNPIPATVKSCLSELSAAQQVTLRGYIGTLRAEMKDLEENNKSVDDPDPHAHYHGHEK
jgi:hypothetical protein